MFESGVFSEFQLLGNMNTLKVIETAIEIFNGKFVE